MTRTLLQARVAAYTSTPAGVRGRLRVVTDGSGASLSSSRRARLAARAELMARCRAFFTGRDYLEVETPIVVPSPGLDLHLDAFAIEGAVFADGALGYLATSPEYQMKRLMAEGFDRIFQLSRCFRRGERGRRHQPEFTMLEWYTRGADADAMMDETEALVRALVPAREGVHGFTGPTACDLTSSFARISVAEAFARFADTGADEMLRLAAEDEDRFFFVWVDRVEPALARLGRPVWVYDYPAAHASLARRRPSDPRFAERFELYIGEVELCNGFVELTDPVEQRERLHADQRARRAQGRPVYPIDERFIASLESGLPACTGSALGFDRLVALALGATDLDEVVAFSHRRL
ncbi:MAG: EF-P lysine aminoacylase EpmA [Myxococcota bacterium]